MLVEDRDSILYVPKYYSCHLPFWEKILSSYLRTCINPNLELQYCSLPQAYNAVSQLHYTISQTQPCPYASPRPRAHATMPYPSPVNPDTHSHHRRTNTCTHAEPAPLSSLARKHIPDYQEPDSSRQARIRPPHQTMQSASNLNVSFLSGSLQL
jgi:hypothetical protein